MTRKDQFSKHTLDILTDLLFCIENKEYTTHFEKDSEENRTIEIPLNSFPFNTYSVDEFIKIINNLNKNYKLGILFSDFFINDKVRETLMKGKEEYSKKIIILLIKKYNEKTLIKNIKKAHKDIAESISSVKTNIENITFYANRFKVELVRVEINGREIKLREKSVLHKMFKIYTNPDTYGIFPSRQKALSWLESLEQDKGLFSRMGIKGVREIFIVNHSKIKIKPQFITIKY
jgi:hypothetical protein